MTVRWGVLGCARVFERRMMPAFRAAADNEVVAVASRARDKAHECAARHGVGHAYGSYEALLEDREIDAVYLPLPNHLHAEWTVKALDAGKHVLCEKPLAVTYADARRMADAARGAGLRLMEGFMYRHHPQHARVGEIVQSGEIGRVALFRGSYSFLADRQGHRWGADAGGGAVFDIGVYPLNAARLQIGAEPVAVTAVASLDPEGADRHTAAILEFPDGRTAAIDCGFDQTFTTRYELVGDEGVVMSERAFQPGDAPVTLTIRRGDDVRTETIPPANHYVHEIEHFGACVRDPARPLWPGEDGVHQTRLVEAVQRSLRDRRRIEVQEVE